MIMCDIDACCTIIPHSRLSNTCFLKFLHIIMDPGQFYTLPRIHPERALSTPIAYAVTQPLICRIAIPLAAVRLTGAARLFRSAGATVRAEFARHCLATGRARPLKNRSGGATVRAEFTRHCLATRRAHPCSSRILWCSLCLLRGRIRRSLCRCGLSCGSLLRRCRRCSALCRCGLSCGSLLRCCSTLCR